MCQPNYLDFFIYLTCRIWRILTINVIRNFHLSKSNSAILNIPISIYFDSLCGYQTLDTVFSFFFCLIFYFVSYFMFDLECHFHYFHFFHHTLIIIIRNAWHLHFANEFSFFHLFILVLKLKNLLCNTNGWSRRCITFNSYEINYQLTYSIHLRNRVWFVCGILNGAYVHFRHQYVFNILWMRVYDYNQTSCDW